MAIDFHSLLGSARWVEHERPILVYWRAIADEMPLKGQGVLVTNGKLVTVAQWERYPEYVLCDMRKRGDAKTGWWSSYGWDGWEWNFDFDDEEISHWASLPLPPESIHDTP